MSYLPYRTIVSYLPRKRFVSYLKARGRMIEYSVLVKTENHRGETVGLKEYEARAPGEDEPHLRAIVLQRVEQESRKEGLWKDAVRGSLTIEKKP